MNSLHDALATFGFVLFVVATTAVLIIRARHRHALEALPAPQPEATDSTPPPSVPLLSSSRQPQPSWMDQHESARTRALKTGCCIYCPAKATHHEPTFKLVRPWYDGMLRYLGVKQLDRRRVATGGTPLWEPSERRVLCSAHFERALGLLEGALALHTVRTAETLDANAKALYEFEMAGVYEQIYKDMEVLRAPRPAAAPGRQLTAVTGVS
jgi:hypothetical protein